VNPETAKRLYRDNLYEPVTIRRIVGAGSTKVIETYVSHGRVYRGERRELVGGIAQQEYNAVVDATQLFNSGLVGDVQTQDYLIDMNGKRYTVTEVKPRRVKTTMVGYKLTLKA